MKTSLPILALSLLFASASMPIQAQANDTSIGDQLAHWSAKAGIPGDARRGEAFFGARHGNAWSCASCHGQPPSTAGRHADTGKRIAPLAPSANPKSITRVAKVEKWFRRNCMDVLARECTAGEKADVLAYLSSLK